ncbi:hypothetical protein M076_2341 [Bacteroides fragilis str. 2-F-2 |uniref:Uncharacterized protein n=1 Tax=Bacteroides fragilis str. 2-F-2 \|nr:hypothetical protein M078_3814 [Bacteroides fragilis str. 2-F-2 \
MKSDGAFCGFTGFFHIIEDGNNGFFATFLSACPAHERK